MAWQQLKTPNLDISYTGGWCLKAVEDAFDMPHVFDSAIDAWNSGQGHNHPGEGLPGGVAVPVYFSLGDVPAGHVAIALPDGRIASSTQEGTHTGLYIHPNLDDLIRIYAQYHGCVYLGWSEGLGTTPVVQLTADLGGGDQMTYQEFIQVLATVAQNNPNYSPDALTHWVTALEGGFDPAQAMRQFLDDGDCYLSQQRALKAYAEAKAMPNPEQYATDRVQGGDTLEHVLSTDLATDANVYRECQSQLASANQAISDQQSVVEQQTSELADLKTQVTNQATTNQQLTQEISDLQTKLTNATRPIVQCDHQTMTGWQLVKLGLSKMFGGEA